MERPPDRATWWILASNALAILAAFRDEGGFLVLLWIFWFQSVVIGWFARKRMLALRRFSTDGLKINDQAVDPTPETQRKTANFFAIHYGAFHLSYLLFLATSGSRIASGSLAPLDWAFVAISAVSFWFTHRGSHRENVEADLARLPNIGSLMVLPYARVVPMHIAIIAGANSGSGRGLLLFALLKTAADIVMHKVEHRWLQRAALLLVASLVASLAAPADAMAQSRELSWPSITVTATLDADGRLRVAERQVMRFTGDWNGGERTFRTALGQKLELRRIARLDTSTGEFRDLAANFLDRVDGFQWADRRTLRWRSRMPTDPPFARAELTYLIEVEYENILQPVDSGRYILSHDFAVSDRAGRIDRFDLTLTLDPVWSSNGQATRTFTATELDPGYGFDVRIPLRYTGAGRPAAVLHGASQSLRRTTAYVLIAAFLLLLLVLLRRESRLGRFAPLLPAREINKEWLDHHVFSRPPEVIGADWDDHTAAPEVAATLARMVQEKKLSSSVKTESLWVFKSEVLHLKLEVPRSQLRGHELALVNALFERRAETTSTKEVRERYKRTGFDPAALIRAQLGELVEGTTPGARGLKPSPVLTILLLLGAVALVGFGLVTRPSDAPVAFTTLAASLPVFGIASLFAYVWRRSVSAMFVRAIFWFVPAGALLGAFSWFVLLQDRFRVGEFVIGGLALWLLALTNSVMNSARSRQSAERIATRKRLAAARRVFRNELAKKEPALRDEWFPYLIAFGLGSHVDRWFRAFGGISDHDPIMATSRSAGGSSSGGRSWTGFGGGGGFSGGGSSSSFAAAVGGMASSVPAPSSSSSGGGGGGGGGGSSSGGGGGGGW